MLYSRGAAGPEATDMVCLLPCLGDIAWIYGDSQSFHAILETVGGEIHVEAQPVEILAECLAVSLLLTSSVASKLKKVYLSRYAHD